MKSVRAIAMEKMRRRVWAHNGLLGGVTLARKSMGFVQSYDSTTDAAKALASEIDDKLVILLKLLKVRVDP